MHALIVISHPHPESLTHSTARKIAEGISASGTEHSFEIADLNAEGFDPRFNAADLAAHLRQGPPPADVSREQSRVDRADALVLVYPVYWWSMPGLLKGWIDRVFANGWAYDDSAYDEGADTGLVKKLGRLKVHLVAIGGASLGTYTRHGYLGAMRTQIDHGIFDYCGAQVAASELLIPSATEPAERQLETARALGRHLFARDRHPDMPKAV